MKIAFDISQIIYGTGVSHYRAQLIKNLLEIDKQNEYILYGFSLRRKKELKDFANSLPKKVETKFFNFPQKILNILWNQLHILKIEKLIGEVDLVHTSDWLEPPSDVTKVTTVHDLVALKFPKITPNSVVSVQKKKLFWVKNESKRIIVPSFQTKKDLLGLGFSEDKINVVYEANNLAKQPVDKVEKVRKKYKIRNKYILAIGTNPRKNLKKIIEAFHLSRAGKNIKLLIVGETRGVTTIHERGVSYLGFVSDEDLSSLLTGAEVLVFPSLYEGLGIPILDSFACETPVVTSNLSSMPEAAGDAAVLVNPTDTRSIAKGIEEALDKPKTLVSKGKKQIKKFSWKKCAQDTLEIYKETLKQ